MEDKINNTPVNSPRSETPDVFIDRSTMNSPFPHIRGQIPRMDTINQERVRNTYICCGENIDKRVLSYIAQLLVSIIVLCFCIVKLTSNTLAFPKPVAKSA